MSPTPRDSTSTVRTTLEYVRGTNGCPSADPNQCSTPCDTSAEPILGDASPGTSYHRSRLRFSPLPQVILTNCTSVQLRSSTPLSRRFNLPRARSAGFGFPRSDSRPFQDLGPGTSPESWDTRVTQTEACAIWRPETCCSCYGHVGFPVLTARWRLRLATP